MRRAAVFTGLLATTLLSALGRADAKTWNVLVIGADPGPYVFNPDTLSIAYGDSVRWTWVSGDHTTTQHDGTQCDSFNPPFLWNALITATSPTFTYVFAPPSIPPVDSTYNYECQVHCFEGMDGLIRIQATGVGMPPAVPNQLPFNWGRIKSKMLNPDAATR
jgi:plastocyanin